MSIKLLPASVNLVDPSQSDVSTSLVPLTQRAITNRAAQIVLVPTADAFAWSSPTRRGEANCIYGTPVEDSQSDEMGSGGQHVSASAWSPPVGSLAIAHHLSYTTGPADWSGRLIDLYA
ncbi:MAG: hypothetical protein WA477_02100 [Candidatus Sulfotelmatobacter sp.]